MEKVSNIPDNTLMTLSSAVGSVDIRGQGHGEHGYAIRKGGSCSVILYEAKRIAYREALDEFYGLGNRDICRLRHYHL